MPFFSKSITDLTSDDLAELRDEAAVENVRLEFKREFPGPDDTLKKLSGFANTFGGYLIVGAAASSSDGRLEDYPGVDPQRNYRQTIIQRCYEGIWPPIEVLISDGIPAPNAEGKVCYVIYVPESMEAPHFLTKRRGAWIRTDEFSQRFEARLAKFEEIQHLANRRALAVDRREHLYTKAVNRFETFVAGEYATHPRTSGQIGATLCLSLCPQFPMHRLISEHELLALIKSVNVPMGQTGFPVGWEETITQQDSVLLLHPVSDFSLVEANVWGQLTYFFEIEYLVGAEGREVAGINLLSLHRYINVYLDYARTVYRELGYNGSLLLRALLKRVQRKPFIYSLSRNVPEIHPASRIDDEISLEISSSAVRLNEQKDEVAGDLLKVLFFSLNWPEKGQELAKLSS